MNKPLCLTRLRTLFSSAIWKAEYYIGTEGLSVCTVGAPLKLSELTVGSSTIVKARASLKMQNKLSLENGEWSGHARHLTKDGRSIERRSAMDAGARRCGRTKIGVGY